MIYIADSADQQVVIELVAQFQQAMQGLEAFGTKLGDSLGAGAQQADAHLTEIEGRAQETAGKFGEAGQSAGESFGQGLTVALAAAAATFLNTMRNTIDTASQYATKLQTLSLTTGDDTQKLQQFEFAMHSVGMSSEQAQMQLTMMERRIQMTSQRAKDTTSIFYQLGLNTKEMAKKDAVSNFELLADKIAGVENPAFRSSAALQIFGARIGNQLIPLLDQGAEGIKKLMGQAELMGGIMPPEVVKSLEEYDAAMKQMQQSTQAVFATLAGPIIPLLTKMADAVMRFYGVVEQLTGDQKLVLLFSALAASFFAFSSGLQVVGSFFAKNLISPELITFLENWNVALRIIIVAAGLVLAAYVTNFGGVRDAVALVYNALKEFFDMLGREAKVAGAAFDAYIRPAFDRLSAALKPLIEAIGVNLSNAITSIDWGAVSQALLDLGAAIGKAIDAITPLIAGVLQATIEFIKWVDPIKLVHDAFVDILAVTTAFINFVSDHKGVVTLFAAAMLTLAGMQGIGAAIVAVNAAIVAFKAWRVAIIATDVWSGMTLLIEAFAVGLKVGLVTAIRAVIVGLWDLIGAEAIATFGISAMIAVIILMITNFNGSRDAVTNWVATIVDGVSVVETGIASLANAIAGLLAHIPLIGSGLASAFRQAADAAERQAARIRASANSIRALVPGKPDAKEDPGFSASGYESFSDSLHPAKDTKPDVTTVVPNAPTTGSKTGSASSAALDSIKDKVQAAKDKFVEMEQAAKLADLAIANLGKNATPAQIADAYLVKLKAVNGEIAAQTGLVAALATAQASTLVLEGGAKDAKDKKAYHDAARAYHTEEQAAVLKEIELQQSLNKIQDESVAKREAYWKSVASDQFSSYAESIKAEEKILALMNLENSTAAEIHAQRLKILKATQDQADAGAKVADAEMQRKLNDLTTAATLRTDRASVAGPDEKGAGGQYSAGVLAMQAAQDGVTKASIEEAAALRIQKSAQDALAALNQRALKNGPTLQAAVDRLATAQTAAASKTDALRIAEEQMRELTVRTSQTVIDTRNAFASLIQSGIGSTLTDIFKGLQGSSLNLTQGFISLFQQSRSFYDIQETFKEITSRLAQVFDAMRPVIDFLLGILIGLTDVFLFLFNAVASVLNLFGLHIEKIKLLNNTLGQLDNTAKPLLQITHDLPTMNEYNKGKWGDLQAQNNNVATNMQQGFNAQLSKLGEIVGVLLGIKLLIGMLGGKSIGSQMGGIMNSIKGLFGGNKATTGPLGVNDAGQFDPNNEAFGSYATDNGAGTSLNTSGTWNPSASGDYGAFTGLDAPPGVTGDYGAFANVGSASSLPDFSTITAATTLGTDATALNTDATVATTVQAVAATDATKKLTGGIGALLPALSLVPSLLGMFGGGGSSGGMSSMLGGGLSSIIGLLGGSGGSGGSGGFLSKILGQGASTGSKDTMSLIQAGMSLFQGISKGGSFGQTLSGLGTGVGMLAGGPVGSMIGGLLGSVIGGMFGPHPTAYKNPDMLDVQNYGQDTANIIGTSRSGGQDFTQDPTMRATFGGMTGAAAMQNELSKGMAQFMKDTGLSAATYATDLAEFGANKAGNDPNEATLKNSYVDKNIGNIGFHAEGAQGTHRYDVLNAALTDFAAGLKTATTALGENFGAASDVNLASLYGNGQVVTTGGGYSVTGSSTAMGGGSATPVIAPVLNVSIGAIHGIDITSVRRVLDPVMATYASDLQRLAAITQRTSGNQQGRQSI